MAVVHHFEINPHKIGPVSCTCAYYGKQYSFLFTKSALSIIFNYASTYKSYLDSRIASHGQNPTKLHDSFSLTKNLTTSNQNKLHFLLHNDYYFNVSWV